MSYKVGQRWTGLEESTRKASSSRLKSCFIVSCTCIMSSAHLPAVSVLLCALALILYNTPADAQADSALDCCLRVGFQSVPKHIVLSYSNQIRGNGCTRDAVVFTTWKGKKLCAPTAREAKWVEELSRFIDNRLKKCKATKFQGKRCEGLKTKTV